MSHPNDISLETRIQVTALVAAQLFGGIKTPHELAAQAKQIVDAVIEQYKEPCFNCVKRDPNKCVDCGALVCGFATNTWDRHHPLALEGWVLPDNTPTLSLYLRRWRCVKCSEAK